MCKIITFQLIINDFPEHILQVVQKWHRRASKVQPPNVAELLAKVSPSTNRPSDEKTLYEQLKAQGLHRESPRRNVRVLREKVAPRVKFDGQETVHEESEGGVAGQREGGEATASREGTRDDEGNMVSFEEFVLVDQVRGCCLLCPMISHMSQNYMPLKSR